LTAGSAEPGRFRPWHYQVGIANAITDPNVETVTVMKASRVGYSVVMTNAIAYFLQHDPSPVLIVQPRVEDAEDFSKTEIAPMLRDIDVMAEIAGDPKSKSSGQTILRKTMLNGSSLVLVGANSPGGFRRITARIVLLDEVDGFPPGGAGSEGDQVALAVQRSVSFWNRKIVLGSTPTIKGLSRIEKSWEQSDQRRYFVPCPHCGEMQVLEWGGRDTPHGIKWRRDAEGNHLPETAFYVCKANGCIIDEADKPGMIAAGEWRATKPFKGHAGFHIWAGYSPHIKAAWGKLVAEWLEVKADPLQRQTFINLALGEPYEDRGDLALSESLLLRRREIWPGEVPPKVAVLTAGVDVQDDRVEIEVVGWGADEESWSIAHEVVEGDTQEPLVWEVVDAFLKRMWRRADGREFEVMAACIDSGGHATQAVYKFAKARLARHIWAIKGESARGGARSPVWPVKRPSARNKAAFRPIILGVNAAKDSIRSRLHIEKHGPGYMHFPVDRDVGYFAQLTSERSVTKSVGGQRFRVWELPPSRTNEALDLRVYAFAALCGLVHFGLQLNRRAEAVVASYVGPAIPAVPVAAMPTASETGTAIVQGPVFEPQPGRSVPRGVRIKIAEAPKRRGFAGRLAGG
jgi:phage terminase large subunit GpA-like protein